MGDIAVSVRELGKRYRIAHQGKPYGRLTESLAGAARTPIDRLRGRPRNRSEWFWALKDVTFDVKRGDVVGIVGRNGAGKSTLLKLLSRITEPTVGRADLHGRVASLLEVGTGFHPELSGRENIYLSGSVLGMRREETRRRFDEIVDFAEVEQFLDTPVKRYSSGMAVRLGFAVAAHLETEILIVDEVLAVGDAAFQTKCLSKMEDVSHDGRTILFVSHNMAAVESLCSKGVLLSEGKVLTDGSAVDIVARYAEQGLTLADESIADRLDRRGSGRLRFTGVEASLRTGSDSHIELSYEGDDALRNVDIAIGLFTTRGEGVANLYTASTGNTFHWLPEKGSVVCHLPRASLVPGHYRANVYCTVNGEVADWVLDAVVVEVTDGDYFGTGKTPPSGYGSVLVNNHWEAHGDGGTQAGS